MYAVMRYALWVRRHLEKEPDAQTRIARGFAEMPEVREVLKSHLDPVRDPALAIRAVYGQWFPWLALLDPEWSSSHVNLIFPKAPDETYLRDAAWETYVVFCQPYDDVLEILKEEYEHAIEKLDVVASYRHYPADPTGLRC